jgi:hypothetical protein
MPSIDACASHGCGAVFGVLLCGVVVWFGFATVGKAWSVTMDRWEQRLSRTEQHDKPRP